MKQNLIAGLLLVTLAGLYLYEQSQGPSKVPLLGEQEFKPNGKTIQNPIIYEISLRPWLYELSQKYNKSITKLNDIPFEEFQKLKDIGVDYVWLMGIWQLGEIGLNIDRSNQPNIDYYKQLLPDFTIDDVIGSPYAITEFRCNSQLGTDDDIIALRQRLNGIGIKLMLDFVPNHSAIDSPFVTEHPEYYIRSPKGVPIDREMYLENGIAYGSDMWDGAWKDTAQWNYFNLDTRAYLQSVVVKIASMSDGMRCDMAMIELNDLFENAWRPSLTSWGYKRPATEFWADAIAAAKKQYPNTLFLAEVYWDREQDLINQGFDLVYEKKLLDTLATWDVNQVRNSINYMSLDYASHSNRFVENHDEVRAIEKFGGKDYVANVAAMISYTLPGAKFINHGQLQGYSNKLDVHLRRQREEKGSEYTKQFYYQLMRIISMSNFRDGQWQRVDVEGDQGWKFLAWKMVNSQEKVVCIINYSEGQGYGKVKLFDVSDGDQYIIELMSGQRYLRNGETIKTSGLEVVVDGWNGQIFKYV